MTHVPPGVLAALWRAGQEFPPAGEPRSAMSLDAVFATRTALGLPQYTAEYICDGDYIRFQCTGCQTIVFQPNTDRGILFEAKMARSHPQDCCDERRTAYVRTGIVTAWPDTGDE
jgi:hypothetical protein